MPQNSLQEISPSLFLEVSDVDLENLFIIPASSGDFVHSTTQTRIVLPLTEARVEFKITSQKNFDLPLGSNIIVDRIGDQNLTEYEFLAWMKYIKSNQHNVIHMFDDDLLYDHRVIPGWIRGRMSRISTLTKIAIVTTDALEERYRNLYPIIFVVPISLPSQTPFRQIAMKKRDISEVMKIGFMGSYTHEQDLYSILPILCDIKVNSPIPLQFEIIGGGSSTIMHNFQQILSANRLFPPTPEYESFLKWFSGNANWDFMIAPLAHTEFNSYKSDIKLLDCSIIGALPVVTNPTPYLPRDGSSPLFWSIDRMSDYILEGAFATDYFEITRKLQNYVKSSRLNSNLEHGLASKLMELKEIYNVFK